MQLGAFDYVTKPFDRDEITLVVGRALQTRALLSEVEDLRRGLAPRLDLKGARLQGAPDHVISSRSKGLVT